MTVDLDTALATVADASPAKSPPRTFGEFHGPASYHVAFKDAIAGLAETDRDDADTRIEQVLSTV